MKHTLIFLKKLLSITSGIPLSSIPYNKKALEDFLASHASNNSAETDNLWSQLQSLRSNTVYEHDLLSDRVILMIPYRARNTIILLGPVCKASTNIPFTELPVLRQVGEMIADYFSVGNQPALAADTPLIHHSSFSGEDIAQMRRVEQQYEYSAALTDAVQQGNLSLALHMISQYDPNTKTAVRNANPLRNAQNYCIVLNTQLRHALERSGIHPYQVDRLSNEIGLEIEQLKHISQLPNFFSGVIRRYCRLVQEHAYPNLRPLTNLAVTYIKEHLADNLTVRETAKALTINANYLSTLFHKDMGMTFIDFVNKERTNQAAALLRHTNLQIQQIASTVGYNNTSYFAKQFVRFQGNSPSHFRRKI